MILRRSFLRGGAALVAAGVAARFSPSARARPIGANGDVRLGVIGLGLKGAQLAGVLAKQPGVRIVAACDVDPVRLAEQVQILETASPGIFATTDMRKVFERSDVDAVLIATSTHWHALATIWACQAGKDVYVEKPVGRTVWEGRKMIEAAERYGRVVQTGTQLRSDRKLDDVIAYIRSGELGAIQWMHGIAYQMREPLARRLPWYPEWLDYDMYCGPTPVQPLERAELHYDWHWNWDTGNGDLVNMGVHMVDVARRFFGDHTRPRRTVSLGGRYVVDDAGEPPNTQFTVMQFDEAPLFFEVRNLTTRPGTRHSDNLNGLRNGLIVQCERGYYAGYYGGGIFDNDGNRIVRKESQGDTVTSHLTNFLDSVRNQRPSDVAAPMQVGHDSARFCHYGNISYRVGSQGAYELALDAVGDVAGAPEALDRMRAHLGEHGVDFDRHPLTIGPWLELSADDDGINGVSGGDDALLERARYYLKEVQRTPYVIPERV